MKKFKALYLGMAMTASAAMMTSCQADMDAPALEEPKATMEANTTISDFKTAFADQTVLCPMKDAASQTPYIIHGRVISSDATGNIYKSIVIQDETAAIALSINQGSTYTDYRLGQEIVLNVTGLYIGYYNGLQQIGWLDEYDGSPSLTFMAWDYFLAHSEKNGFPNQDVSYVDQAGPWPAENPYCIVTSFSKLPASGADFRNMQSQLVEFRNVYFEEGGKETYAPYQESVNRTLKDANGGSLTVRTSGYSNFYNEMIPEGTGTVRGILSYYGDSWQLLLRGLGDVMITKKGQKDDPYTVPEAIEVENQGAAGWVKAYIVGSVKAGVSTVTSNADVIFGADAEMDNNILIAASADETDWTKCLAVELPQGSAFRASVNLVDNPGVLKKEILVRGNLETFLGMPGLTGNSGTADEVEVDGVTIGGGDTPVIPSGDGTVKNPYSVAKALEVCVANGETSTTNVYTKGYITNIKKIDTGYGNAEFYIADTPGGSPTLYVYRIYYLDNNKFTDANALKVGDEVVIYTALINYKGNTPETSKGYIYSINGDTGGGDTPGGDAGEAKGDGTEANPYNIAYVQASTADATGVWIEGYVAGYVADKSWSTAVFSKEATDGSTNYTNGTNLILSSVAPTESNASNSVPVAIPSGSLRDVLAVGKNPDIYGKKVLLKGDVTKYFGMRGIKNVSEYKILD